MWLRSRSQDEPILSCLGGCPYERQKGDTEKPRDDRGRARGHSATSQRTPGSVGTSGHQHRFSSGPQEDNPPAPSPRTGLQDGEKIHLCCFKHPRSVGFCDSGHRTVHNWPRPPGDLHLAVCWHTTLHLHPHSLRPGFSTGFAATWLRGAHPGDPLDL